MQKPKIISVQKMITVGELQKWLSDNLGIYKCRKTVYNWSNHGRNDKVLKIIKLGNKRFTCKEWIMEFLEGVRC